MRKLSLVASAGGALNLAMEQLFSSFHWLDWLMVFFLCMGLSYAGEIRNWAAPRTKGWAWWYYALCITIPLAVYIGLRGIVPHPLKAVSPPLPAEEQSAKSPETMPHPASQEEVLRMMRTLLAYMRLPNLKENPGALVEPLLHAKVLAERLQSLGLAPPEGYTVSFDAQGHRTESIHPDNWLTYLTYMIPHVEEFGVEQALEISSRLNEQIAGNSERE